MNKVKLRNIFDVLALTVSVARGREVCCSMYVLNVAPGRM